MKDDDKPKTEAGVDVPLADQTPVAEDKIGPAPAAKPEQGAASPFTRDLSAEEITPKDSFTASDPAPSLAPAPEKIGEFDPEPVAVAAPAQKRGAAGGFIALLLGGALAALGGFALSHYNLLELRAELDGPAFESRLAALETAQGALQSEIAAAQGLAKSAEGKAIAASDAASQNPVSAEISALNAQIGRAHV